MLKLFWFCIEVPFSVSLWLLWFVSLLKLFVSAIVLLMVLLLGGVVVVVLVLIVWSGGAASPAEELRGSRLTKVDAEFCERFVSFVGGVVLTSCCLLLLVGVNVVELLIVVVSVAVSCLICRGSCVLLSMLRFESFTL